MLTICLPMYYMVKRCGIRVELGEHMLQIKERLLWKKGSNLGDVLDGCHEQLNIAETHFNNPWVSYFHHPWAEVAISEII